MIGVDISDRSIKVVEVMGSDNNELRLNTVCWSPLTHGLMESGLVIDVPGVTEALKQAFVRCSPREIEGNNVVASIPESQSFVRVIEVPPMPQEELDEAVSWAVRKHIPFDIDNMYLDWEPIGLVSPGMAVRQVMVGAAQRRVVDPLLAVLDSLRLNVVALELESQAVVRCLLPIRKEDVMDIRGVLMVDLGATLTDVSLFDRGAMRVSANVEWGGDQLTDSLVEKLGITPEEAIELKSTIGAAPDAKNQEVADILREATLELAEKVKSALGDLSAQLSEEEKVRAILLSGGSANLLGISEIFSSVFAGMPVQLGNPLTNLLTPTDKSGINLSRGDAMHFTTAIGLALRPSDLK